jgi:predicted MPP superfamily phosphohydrolase
MLDRAHALIAPRVEIGRMLLLHLSDIHFRSPDCVNPDLDPDRPFRTRMLQDARQRTETLGPVDAILVSGDIAFKGDPTEYAAAYAWLQKIAVACGCPFERVFVIPGNHDVDRRVITTVPAVRNAQQAIIRADVNKRERELREQFRNEDTGRALLAPLAAYNDFAARFGCQIYPPDRLYWRQDIPLVGDIHLRVYGLTSTLLSGAGAPNGKDDDRESLYLSPLQTVLDPVDDIANLVMCHHPPDWFMDQDEVDDKMRGRAAIHLFGHKHRQRIFKDDGYMRFSAGAVNPDRYEGGWQPCYNLIKLSVVGHGRGRAFDIEAHLLQWQSNPDRFRPVQTNEGNDVFQHRILIPGRTSIAAAARELPSVAVAEPSAPRVEAVDVEAAMSNESTRNLILRFWNLTSSQRREITQGLGLIQDEDLKLPEPERYGRALLRARERGLLDRVAQEVEQREHR